jgi:hypothetical protein
MPLLSLPRRDPLTARPAQGGGAVPATPIPDYAEGRNVLALTVAHEGAVHNILTEQSPQANPHSRDFATRRSSRRRRGIYLLLTLVVAAALAWVVTSAVMNSTRPLLVDDFDQPNGLVTNEFAYFNPGNPSAVRSPIWLVTSGSLFARDHAGWTGVPDRGLTGPSSAHVNDSVVFRAVTRDSDFRNVSVSFRLYVQHWVQGTSVPSYQGVHVFMRYQSPYMLYAVSVDRRDGVIVIKKKVPGGPSGGGVYYTLATKHIGSLAGRWEDVRVSAVNNGAGGVRLELWLDGKLMLTAIDDGVGDVPPITNPGRVGLRGDYTQFAFTDFAVSHVSSG